MSTQIQNINKSTLPPIVTKEPTTSAAPTAIERAWYDEAVRRTERVEAGEIKALDGHKALAELEEELRRMQR